MDQIQKKIELFEDHLINSAKKQHDELISSARKKQDDRIKTAENTLQEEKRALEERNYQIIFRDKNRIIAGGHNQAKNDRLALYHQIQSDFNQTLLDMSKKLPDSEVYKHYFEKSVAAVPQLFGDKKELVFAVTERDRLFLVMLVEKYLSDYSVDIDVSENEDILSGGFTVHDKEQLFFCNNTIAHLLQEEKKRIGTFLNEKMAPYREGEYHDK